MSTLFYIGHKPRTGNVAAAMQPSAMKRLLAARLQPFWANRRPPSVGRCGSRYSQPYPRVPDVVERGEYRRVRVAWLGLPVCPMFPALWREFYTAKTQTGYQVIKWPPVRSEVGRRRQNRTHNCCVGKQNQDEPVGFRVDPVCKALHRSYSGMDQPLSSCAAACAPGPASGTRRARASPH